MSNNGRTFKWSTEIFVDETDIRDYLGLDEDDEITDDMYYEVAEMKLDYDDCEYEFECEIL